MKRHNHYWRHKSSRTQLSYADFVLIYVFCIHPLLMTQLHDRSSSTLCFVSDVFVKWNNTCEFVSPLPLAFARDSGNTNPLVLYPFHLHIIHRTKTPPSSSNNQSIHPYWSPPCSCPPAVIALYGLRFGACDDSGIRTHNPCVILESFAS